MSAHQTGFQERIARINAGEGFTKATVYIGLDTAFTYVPKNKRCKGCVSEKIANAGYALSFPISMAVGLLCHVLERYAEFVLIGRPDPNASIDLQMVKVAVTGFALTVVASHLLGLRDKGLMLPKLLGVAGGMLFLSQRRSHLAACLRTGVLAHLGGADHLDDRAAFDILAGHQLSILTRMATAMRCRMGLSHG